MKIRLNKRFIIQLYYSTLQAERSFHKVLGNNWSDLLAYYQGGRSNAIQQFVSEIEGLMERNGLPLVRPKEEEIIRSFPTLGLFQYLFGRIIARWKRRWAFPAHELCFMGSNLLSVLRFLGASSMPDADNLISLRKHLCWCRSIIECRCHGLPIFQFGIRVEHLYQSAWITPIKLEELLGEEQTPKYPSKKSA
jgi:hypothetical protein